MNAIDRYFELIQRQFSQILRSQRDEIEHAAALVAEAIRQGRFLYAFGTGHSHMLAEEVFYRAGGIANAVPILDPALMLHESASASSEREQQPGYAAQVLSRYPLTKGDVLVIASNSGRNAVPVEMALAAQELGVKTIAITSLAHSRAFPSRHASGRRLFEIAEVVLDNAGVVGDAGVELAGLPRRAGPTSTLTGALILNLIVVRAIELGLICGHVADVYASSNSDVPGWNATLVSKYREQIRHL